MAFTLAVFALLIAALSAVGVAAPARLTRWVTAAMRGPAGLALAVAARLLLALLLWLTADESRAPLAFRVLAILALVAALVLPIVGRGRLLRLMHRVAEWPAAALRAWCVFGVVFAVALLWAIYPAM